MIQTRIVGIALVSISMLSILLFLLKKNEPFFNLREVVSKQFSLFQKSTIHYIVFYLIPLVFAVGLSMIYIVDDEFLSESSPILSILISMQFAVLSILSTFNTSTIINVKQKGKAQKVIIETVNAVIFDCLLCLFMLLHNLCMIVISERTVNWIPIDVSIMKTIVSAITYYIFSVILLNLLLIVKQLSRLVMFNFEVKRKE